MGANIKLSALAAVCAALLQACGGGGSGGGSGVADSGVAQGTGSNDSPSVVAQPGLEPTAVPQATLFVPGAAPYFLIMHRAFENHEPLESYVQNPDGSVTDVDDGAYSLLGDAAELTEVSSDTHFAMGRWVKGIIQRGSDETSTFPANGSGRDSAHYLIFNEAQRNTMPQLGSFLCDAGVFTTPTYLDGGSGNHSDVGTVSGQATLNFREGNPFMGGSISVDADGATGSVTLQAKLRNYVNGVYVYTNPDTGGTTTETLVDPGSYYTDTRTGTFNTGPFEERHGAAVVLGAAPAGSYYVMATYKVVLSNRARYAGVARFLCKA